MSNATSPHPVKLWAGVILFFAIGVAIALGVTSRIINQGGSLAAAIAVGAGAGGMGAWLVFYVVLNTLKTIKRSRPRGICGRGVAGG